MAFITPLSFQPWKLKVNAGLDYFISTSQSSHPLKSERQLQYLSYQIILAASTQTKIKILVSLMLIWLSLYRSKNWNKLLCDENSSNVDRILLEAVSVLFYLFIVLLFIRFTLLLLLLCYFSVCPVHTKALIKLIWWTLFTNEEDESQREHLPMFVSIFNQVFNIHDWVDQFFLCTLFCEKL